MNNIWNKCKKFFLKKTTNQLKTITSVVCYRVLWEDLLGLLMHLGQMLLVLQHCREANIVCYRLPEKDEPCDLWDYSTQFFFTDLLADPLERGLFLRWSYTRCPWETRGLMVKSRQYLDKTDCVHVIWNHLGLVCSGEALISSFMPAPVLLKKAHCGLEQHKHASRRGKGSL